MQLLSEMRAGEREGVSKFHTILTQGSSPSIVIDTKCLVSAAFPTNFFPRKQWCKIETNQRPHRKEKRNDKRMSCYFSSVINCVLQHLIRGSVHSFIQLRVVLQHCRKSCVFRPLWEQMLQLHKKTVKDQGHFRCLVQLQIWVFLINKQKPCVQLKFYVYSYLFHIWFMVVSVWHKALILPLFFLLILLVTCSSEAFVIHQCWCILSGCYCLSIFPWKSFNSVPLLKRGTSKANKSFCGFLVLIT